MTQESQGTSPEDTSGQTTEGQDAATPASPEVVQASPERPSPELLSSDQVEDLHAILDRSIPAGTLTGLELPTAFGAPEDMKGYRLSGGVLVLTFRTATYGPYDALPEDARLHLLLRRVHFHPHEIRIKQGREQETYAYAMPDGELAGIAARWSPDQWALSSTVEDQLDQTNPGALDLQEELRRIVELPSFDDWRSMGVQFSGEGAAAVAGVHKKYRMKKPPAWQVALEEWVSGLRRIGLARDEARYGQRLQRMGVGHESS